MNASTGRVITLVVTTIIGLGLMYLGWTGGALIADSVGGRLPPALLGMVRSLAQFGGLALGLGAEVLVGRHLVAPVLVRITFAMPSTQGYVPFAPDVHPLLPSDRERIARESAALYDLGFELVAHLAVVLTSAAGKVVHAVLFYNRERDAVAQVFVGALTHTAFWTHLDRDHVRVSHSNERFVDTVSPPWFVTERFPSLDTRRLWAAHCALVNDDEKRAARTYRPDPPDVLRDPVAYVAEYEARSRVWNRERGRNYLDETGRIRLTWRGAFFMTRLQTPRVQGRLRREAVARAEVRLQELGV